jgi:nitric oxide reductase subunit C
MKRTTFGLLLTVAITTFTFAMLINYSINQIVPSQVSKESVKGKKVWEEKGCIQCHAILGNGGYSAPDLTDVISRRGEEWVVKFLQNPPILKTSKTRRHIGLEKKESENMVNFLIFIEEIRVPDWPPEPLLIKSM